MQKGKVVPIRHTGALSDRLRQYRVIESLPAGPEKERLMRLWWRENRPVAAELLYRLLGAP